MAVVIRMKRAGAKKRPFYRIVVADSRFARDGRYIEQLGHYDPLTNPAKFVVDKDRFAQWILKGAKPSESIAVMMSKYAPEALRPARLPAVAEPAAPAAPAVAAAEPKKAKPAAKKAVRKPRVAKKGSEKKAKTRAKAKAKKSTGAEKPKAAKKTKK